MSRAIPLADHLAADSINRLNRAATERHADAKHLLGQKRLLAALYFFGYSVEMCLCAAYYRKEGVQKAELVYKHWRPELRYKTTDVTPQQLDEVHKAASWFMQYREGL